VTINLNIGHSFWVYFKHNILEIGCASVIRRKGWQAPFHFGYSLSLNRKLPRSDLSKGPSSVLIFPLLHIMTETILVSKMLPSRKLNTIDNIRNSSNICRSAPLSETLRPTLISVVFEHSVALMFITYSLLSPSKIQHLTINNTSSHLILTVIVMCKTISLHYLNIKILKRCFI
jgi:hypothetical protein